MAKSEKQKQKLLYLKDYLTQYSDEAHPVTVADMIEYLGQNGIVAERKSIYSDLNALRDYGMDIVMIKNNTMGYYLASRTFEGPEVKLLIDAVQSSRFLTEKKSAALIQKLESLSSRPEASLLGRQVVVSGRVKTMEESIYYAVDAIQTAISDNFQIAFDYTEWGVDKQRHRRGQRHLASPWALVWNEDNYYLLAYTQAHGITHYRVDKMRHIVATDALRTGLEQLSNLDLAQYSKKVFGMFNGETTMVKMRFHNSLAGVVLDRFGTDVMLILDGPEHFLFTTEIAVSPLFLSWIIGFGMKAKILWPQPVVDACRALCQEVLRLYD